MVILCNGVPIESVSKMLNHIKFATTKIQTKVEKKISEDMAALSKNWGKAIDRKESWNSSFPIF